MGLFGKKGRIDPEKLRILKEHELDFIKNELEENIRSHSMIQELWRAISSNDSSKIKQLLKSLAKEEHVEEALLRQIIHIEKIRGKDKKKLAEDILHLMTEITSEFFVDEKNLFIRMYNTGRWNSEIERLIKSRTGMGTS